MQINTEKKNSANATIKAEFSKDELNSKVDELAKKTGKEIKVDGFRKGKVPAIVVKKLYGKKLEQDAEAELVRKAIDEAYKELGISQTDVIGDIIFKKYEKQDDKIEVEILVSLNPKFDAKGYEDAVPSYEVPEVTEDEINERLQKLAEQNSKPISITEDRELQNGDIAIFDFTGYLNSEPFEGGKAENYELEIGSNQFIPGFEEQMVGMKKGENKKITVKFPDDYHSEELKGKEVEFDITLHDIKTKEIPSIDDELAKKILKKDDATLEDLKKDVIEEITLEKLRKMYQDELKPKLLEALVEKFEFDLPENIVEQEIDNLANQKAHTLSKEELEELKGNEEKIKELRESVRDEAQKSVKATFVVDAIAKKEDVSVSENDVMQTLYYEAIISGQDPQELVKYYKENNLFPAIMMGMIEDRLFEKLLGLDKVIKDI